MNAVKRRNKYFLTVIILFSSYNLGLTQGLLSCEEKKELLFIHQFDERSSSLTRGENNGLLNYSLESFLPEIGDQTNSPSCVGWATSYYAFTIVKRMENGLDFPAMSPWSPYNRYQFRKFKNDFCSNGCYIEEVLNILQLEGGETFIDYPYKHCAVDSSNINYPDKISKWCRINGTKNQMRSALLSNCPVVIGLKVMDSYTNGYSLQNKYVDDRGILQINQFQNGNVQGGGHALCVVAFNDTLAGGAFKIANSWGSHWGNNGFCWLKYSDLEYISTAFVIFPNRKLESKKGKFITEGIQWKNATDSTIYLSYGFINESGLVTKGWYSIAKENSFVLDISNRLSNQIYWKVMNANGQYLTMDGQLMKLNCFDKKAFEINNNIANLSTENLEDYSQYQPINQALIEKINVGFVSEKRVISNLSYTESPNFELLNRRWNGTYPLLDPFSKEVIVKDMSSKEEYSIFVINDNEIMPFVGTAKNIMKIKELKFLTEQNARAFLK
jgi:uncharacterized membrane protein